MSVSEILTACGQQGYTLTAHTADGVVNGIAFRATPETGTLEMSLNIPENQLSKLQGAMAGTYPGLTVAHHHFGILFVWPNAAQLSGDDFVAWIQKAAKEAALRIGVSYDDKFVKDTEPLWCFFSGAAGALLGALLGVLPWILVTNLLHIQFGYLGFLISIGSFLGYRQFRGAHNTRFAVAMIVIFSLLAMLFPDMISTLLFSLREGTFTGVGTLLRQLFTGDYWRSIIPSMGFGLIFNVIGLLSVRTRVLSYTHEPRYLRRRK